MRSNLAPRAHASRDKSADRRQIAQPGAEPAEEKKAAPKPSGDVDADFWRRRTIGGFAKRVFDVITASAAVLFLLPLFALLAVLVKAHDGGPVFYGHTRIGRGGRPFPCMKFRSMAANSDELLARHLAADPLAAREWERTRKLINDPRITPIGAFLRASSLDELPQLFNILAGDMSVVGPRPIVAEELAYYGLARIHYLSARPGLTGLWQVEGRSRTGYRERVRFDSVYALRWTLLGDFTICLKTIPAVLSRRGAY